MQQTMALVFLTCTLLSMPGVAEQKRPSSPESKVTALLIIDIQNFYFAGGDLPLSSPEAAARNAAKILEKFRKNNRLVIHVGHNAKTGMAFHQSVAPRSNEKIFYKNEVNAFNGTELLSYLRERKVMRLVIVGMQTHMCVEAAVRSAHDLGFECILVEDACATRNLKYKDKEISAPDVHNATLSTLDGAYAKVMDTQTFLASD